MAEKDRPLEGHIKEYGYNRMQDLLEESKLSQYAYEESHQICCKEVKVLQYVPNYIHGK
jgi:hypothetical protein